MTSERVAWYSAVTAVYAISILYFGLKVETRDWHDVPVYMRGPFYVCLAFAIVAHIVSLVWCLAECDEDKLPTVGASAITYALLCMIWLPLARQAHAGRKRISKNWVRLLLLLSAVPLSLICFVSFDTDWVLGVVSFLPVFHALVLDAGVYGLNF